MMAECKIIGGIRNATKHQKSFSKRTERKNFLRMNSSGEVRRNRLRVLPVFNRRGGRTLGVIGSLAG